MAAVLGLQRVVFVQASAYGSDNSCLIDTLKEAGRSSRGIAVIDENTTQDELHLLHEVGVRGVRVNAETFGIRSAGEIERLLRETAERVLPLGWHVQLFAALPTIVELESVIDAMPVPVVIDHMGMAKGALGVGQDGFGVLLGLVERGTWVKVSGAYRVSSAEPDFADAAPIARALIAANPQRVVWGTDWPHTGKHAHAKLDAPPVIDYRSLDDGHLLSLLSSWIENETLVQGILVDNPAILYGFGEEDLWVAEPRPSGADVGRPL
jgi:predicted TIM-barrel fold metal-dependent hydrolase